jgi:hypothetical protein
MRRLIVKKPTINNYSESVFFSYCTKVLDRDFFKRKKIIKPSHQEKGAEKREYREKNF